VKPVDIRQVIPGIKAGLMQSAEITRLLRAEAELNADLQQMQDQLIHADKLVSIGQLAAGIAQEINEPMDYVQANVATLEQGMSRLFDALDAIAARRHAGQHDGRSALQEIERAHELSFLREDMPALLAQTHEGLRRISRIVRELQDFSRIDAPDRWQRVDLRQCLESTLQLLGSELRRKAELVTEFGETPEIECLPGQVSQVIMNLLVNALQAIGETETGRRGRITARTGSADGQAWLEIEDNGCGIAPDYLKRIFHPFFTTRPGGTGTGLGLSLSCGIVQRHGGEIGVRSRLGEGAVFRVTLPQRQPQR
jgi:signal transduction histidine kinase